MLNEIRYTLLSDGLSDKALMPVIDWTISKIRPDLLVQGNHANLSLLRIPPKDLSQRMRKALELYPCDLLFVHRDGEGEPFSNRQLEIERAKLALGGGQLVVEVIPVRMMETWLLIDAQAIKTAAGNPNAHHNVVLPKPNTLEKIPDPKAILQDHLRRASGLKGRQLDKFNVGRAIHLVAENIIDFSLLNGLSAYNAFVQKLDTVLSVLDHRT